MTNKDSDNKGLLALIIFCDSVGLMISLGYGLYNDMPWNKILGLGLFGTSVGALLPFIYLVLPFLLP